jgi:hypothetical protein
MYAIVSLAIFPFAIAMGAAAALDGTDPAVACRQAHAADPPAHIACLEAALRRYTGTEAPAAEASAAAPAAVPAAAAADQPEGLGSEQVLQTQRARGDTPPEQATVSIVSATYNAQELGIFRLADGQVWRETEPTPRHQRLQPGRQYRARIERGAIGGYRMYVEGVRRMLKVERLQ